MAPHGYAAACAWLCHAAYVMRQWRRMAAAHHERFVQRGVVALQVRHRLLHGRHLVVQLLVPANKKMTNKQNDQNIQNT